MSRIALMVLMLSPTCAICNLQAAEEAAPAKITFEEHVKPIFREHCFTCHNQNEKKGGLALDTYASTIEGGASGEVVYEGDGEFSRLWMVMAHEDTPVMPPGQDKLAQSKLDIVKQWIDSGLLENAGSKVKKKNNALMSFSASADGKPEGPAAMPETVWKQPVVVTSRPGAVTAIKSSPWAPLVAIGGQSQVLLYNTDTGELAGVLPFPDGEPQSLNFSKDGSYLLVGGGHHSSTGYTVLYDIRTGDRILKVGDELDIVFGADANSNLTQVAMGGPKRLVHVHDINSGEQIYELKKHTDWVYDVEYSPDGILIASGDRSGGLVLWEADTGRFYLDLAGHRGGIRGIAWRADSNMLASASLDGTVKLWEVFNGKQIKSFNAHGGGVTSIDMARDGRIVTGGKDRVVKVWDANGKMLAQFPAMPEAVLEVAFTHDGSHVVAGDWSGKVMMWKADDPKQARELNINPPTIEVRLASAKKVAEEAQNLFTQRQANEQALSSKRTALTTQLDGYNQGLAATEEKSAKAAAELQAANSAATQAAAALAQASQQHQAALAKVNQSASATKANADSRNAAATELVQAEASLKAALDKRDSISKEIEKLDATLASQAPGSEEYNATSASRKTAAENHAASISEVAAASSAVKAATEKVSATLAAFQQTQEALTNEQLNFSKLQASVATARLNDTQAKQRVVAAAAAAKAATDELQQLKTNIANATKEIEALRPKVDAAKQELQQSTAARDAAVAKATSLEADLAAFTSAAANLANAQAEQDKLLAEAQQQVDAATALATEVESKLGGEGTKLDELKKQVEALQAVVNELRNEKRKHDLAGQEATAKAESIAMQRQKIADRLQLFEAAYGDSSK